MQRALGIGTGCAGDEKFMHALTRHAENAPEARLVAVAGEAGGTSCGEFVPQRSIRARLEGLAGLATPARKASSGFRGQARGGFETGDERIKNIKSGMRWGVHRLENVATMKSVIY